MFSYVQLQIVLSLSRVVWCVAICTSITNIALFLIYQCAYGMVNAKLAYNQSYNKEKIKKKILCYNKIKKKQIRKIERKYKN